MRERVGCSASMRDATRVPRRFGMHLSARCLVGIAWYAFADGILAVEMDPLSRLPALHQRDFTALSHREARSSHTSTRRAISMRFP